VIAVRQEPPLRGWKEESRARCRVLAANQFALHLLGLSGGNRESGDLDDDLEALDTHQVYNFTEAAESGATTPFHLPSAGYPITLRASEPSRPVPS
jgi:hypothetical protein